MKIAAAKAPSLSFAPLALVAGTPPFLLRCPSLAAVSPRIVASISTPPSQQQQTSLAGGKSTAWEVFAKNVSGEWDGYGAEFTSSGTPRELPSAVVPEAFREWDVQLYDWQTQCPTIANESVHYRLIRLLPTVGCEADAATQYSIDDRWAADPNSGAEFLAFHVSGSYVAVWPGRRVLRENFEIRNSSKIYSLGDDKQGSFEVEHCFVQDGQPKFRVRILQQISMEKSMEADCRTIPILKSITIQREKWESEFRNGEVLGGCSTSGSAFATMPAVQGSELSGVWHCDTFLAQLEQRHVGIQQLVHTGSDNEMRKLSKNILPLPKGVWSELIELEDGNFSLATGWLVNAETAITSNCEFISTGKAKSACMKFEKRVG